MYFADSGSLFLEGIPTATIEFVYFNCTHIKHEKPLTPF